MICTFESSDTMTWDDSATIHDNHSEILLHNIHLEAAKIEAFNPPKQDNATASGIVQLNIPNTRSANV